MTKLLVSAALVVSALWAQQGNAVFPLATQNMSSAQKELGGHAPLPVQPGIGDCQTSPREVFRLLPFTQETPKPGSADTVTCRPLVLTEADMQTTHFTDLLDRAVECRSVQGGNYPENQHGGTEPKTNGAEAN